MALKPCVAVASPTMVMPISSPVNMLSLALKACTGAMRLGFRGVMKSLEIV
jgi:hypothetical protein